jgi:hypothetical protein
MSMALRYPLRKAAWHNKMAFFDKSIIPVTDINGLVHLAKDEYIELTPPGSAINLSRL